MSIGPDYKSYTIDELLEAHEAIDRKASPLRFKVLNDEITSRSIALTKSGVEREQKGETVDVYVPNEVPIWEQLKNILLSIGVILFGGIGVFENDLAVKICRRCETVYHLKDEAAWVMYASMLIMAVGLVSEVVDHYDKRNNEHVYHRISNLTMLPGLVLFGLAMYLHTQ